MCIVSTCLCGYDTAYPPQQQPAVPQQDYPPGSYPMGQQSADTNAAPPPDYASGKDSLSYDITWCYVCDVRIIGHIPL